MSVIERLKTVRHTLNVSQKIFARNIFISTSQYACLESGHRKIKETVLDTISKVYNVNREWLSTGNGEMFDREPPDVKLDELISIFKRLNGYFQGYILEHIKQLEKIQEKELREKK
jgi:transcriptional regulator with XRE-family HTH domain